MSALQIGQLARQFNLPVETVRYYERVGLLPEASRTSGNYRVYNQEHLEQLRFVVNCRKLDMTQDEIRRLLQLRAKPRTGCEDVNVLIDDHIADVARRISDLNALLSELRKLRRSCIEDTSHEDCRILKNLYGPASKNPASGKISSGRSRKQMNSATRPRRGI
jgi:Cd(II)/Pb(II)-responsive transcriptional regulator